MTRCLITDGTASRSEADWLSRIGEWMERGVELLQIRERDLTSRALAELSRKVLRLQNPRGTKVLINDRADVAMACGAHGVHLRGGSISPGCFARPDFLVTVACHSLADVEANQAASYLLLAPIFAPLSKNDARPVLGTHAIKEAVRITSVPVLALGGITAATAAQCIDAGAAGIAGISYFR